MRFRNLSAPGRLLLVLCLSIGAAGPRVAYAGSAEANGTTIIHQLNVPGGALPRVSLLTHTEDTAGATNAITLEGPGVIGGAVDNVGFFAGGVFFGATWGWRGKAKPAAVAGEHFLRSKIAPAGGTIAVAKYDPATAMLKAIAIVGGKEPPGITGKTAGARATDPISVPPGNYTYRPDLMNTSLSLNPGLEYAGIDFDAYEVGISPKLWTLSLTANTGHITGPADLTAVFAYDPARLTITDPDPGNPAPLVQKIADRIKNSFDYSVPGTARRTSTLILFDAVYHVTSTVDVEAGLGAATTHTSTVSTPVASRAFIVGLALLLIVAGFVALRGPKRHSA